MFPPASLVVPANDPAIPELKDEANTGELLDWLLIVIDTYRQAWQESEADKAAIRKWMEP